METLSDSDVAMTDINNSLFLSKRNIVFDTTDYREGDNQEEGLRIEGDRIARVFKRGTPKSQSSLDSSPKSIKSTTSSTSCWPKPVCTRPAPKRSPLSTRSR